MALQLSNYTSPAGAPSSAAYARIYRVTGDKNGYLVVVQIFYNQASSVPIVQGDNMFDIEPTPLDTRTYSAALSDGPSWAQLYTFLKTQPLFAGATDV